MRRARDTHQRTRGSEGGRLEKVDLVRQTIKLADGELVIVLDELQSTTPNRAAVLDRLTLCRRLLAEAMGKRG